MQVVQSGCRLLVEISQRRYVWCLCAYLRAAFTAGWFRQIQGMNSYLKYVQWERRSQTRIIMSYILLLMQWSFQKWWWGKRRRKKLGLIRKQWSKTGRFRADIFYGRKILKISWCCLIDWKKIERRSKRVIVWNRKIIRQRQRFICCGKRTAYMTNCRHRLLDRSGCWMNCWFDTKRKKIWQRAAGCWLRSVWSEHT